MGTHFFSVTCIRNMQRIILFSGLFSCLLAFSTSGWVNPNAIRDLNLESINEIENHGRLKRSPEDDENNKEIEEDDDSSEESKETKEDEESNEDDDKDFSEMIMTVMKIMIMMLIQTLLRMMMTMDLEA